MPYPLEFLVRRARFAWQCRAFWNSPPITLSPGGLRIVTMLRHRDVLMYLIAIKSLHRQLGAGQVTIAGDGSLTPGDVDLLKSHVRGVEIASIASVPNTVCPKGGCWERLLYIADRVHQCYVIQMDADTATIGSVEEVADCIRENRSFTLLGHRSHPYAENVEDFVRMRPNPGTHIQSISESNFHKLPNAANVKYLRGNAGFVGYAKGSFDRSVVERFSSSMSAICGRRWNKWGSEQVTSNLVVANSPSVMALPHPKYTSYYKEPGVDYDAASFIHFLGRKRFSDGVYPRMAKRILKALQDEPYSRLERDRRSVTS